MRFFRYSAAVTKSLNPRDVWESAVHFWDQMVNKRKEHIGSLYTRA